MIKTERANELLIALSIIDNYINISEPNEYTSREKEAIYTIKSKLKEVLK